MNVLRLKVKLRRREGIVDVDTEKRSVMVLECSLMDNCSQLYGFCQPFCELIVAAKDYAFKRRKPKAEVVELECAKLN